MDDEPVGIGWFEPRRRGQGLERLDDARRVRATNATAIRLHGWSCYAVAARQTRRAP